MRAHHALRRRSLDLLAALLVCGWLLALAACAPPGNTPTSPSAPYFSAVDVSMDSPTDGWAVGKWITPPQSPPAFGEPYTPGPQYATSVRAMAHYHDGQWRLASQSVMYEIDPDQPLYHIRMLSPTDGWATARGAIYHYDGVRWSLALPATPSITIADLRMYSPDIGWAVGPEGILQYTQGVWHNVTAALPPPPADWESQWPYPGLRSVAIASPTDVWAMGDGGMIWHCDGAHWNIAASPYFPNRFYTSASVDGDTSAANLANFAAIGHNVEALYASQMLTPDEGWAVGGARSDSGLGNWGPAVVERYQEGAWQIAHIFPTHVSGQAGLVSFASIAMTSPHDGWIGGAWGREAPFTGDMPPPDWPRYAPLLLHYHSGQWTFVSAPTTGAIHRLVMVSPDEGWAASDGGLLHYTSGQWRLVSVQPAS